MKPFDPQEWPEFVQTIAFTRDCGRLGLSQEALHALEVEILKKPSRHPFIPGTGGVRKVRFAPPGGGQGKRGAYRVLVGDFPQFGKMLFVSIFAKGDKADLTSDDKKAIHALILAYRKHFAQDARERLGDQGSPDDE